jgi:hypothetical protein
MKVLTRIVTVFIAINLMTTTTGLGQDPSEEVRRKVQNALAQNQANLDNARVSVALAQAKHATGRVLLVLTGEVKAQDVAATTEDLYIMSRIFDKKLEPAYATDESRLRSANIDRLFSNLRHRDGSQGTQAIYLHGYAALFLMNVDFPLSAPPKVDVEKVEKDVDPVWEGTKREIVTSGKTPEGEYAYVQYDSLKEYEGENVEELKTDLTKALKHAANIRNLKPDELIILAVAGTQQPAVLQEVTVADGKTYRVISRKPDASSLLAPALLTIRAKKIDIDAYAKGDLDLDKFRERIQFLTSHASLGPVRAEETEWRARY